jgi:hypothetical protein
MCDTFRIGIRAFDHDHEFHRLLLEVIDLRPKGAAIRRSFKCSPGESDRALRPSSAADKAFERHTLAYLFGVALTSHAALLTV